MRGRPQSYYANAAGGFGNRPPSRRATLTRPQALLASVLLLVVGYVAVMYLVFSPSGTVPTLPPTPKPPGGGQFVTEDGPPAVPAGKTGKTGGRDATGNLRGGELAPPAVPLGGKPAPLLVPGSKQGVTELESAGADDVKPGLVPVEPVAVVESAATAPDAPPQVVQAVESAPRDATPDKESDAGRPGRVSMMKQAPNIEADEDKRDAVKRAFLHAWSGYKKFAWGADKLKPVSKQPENDGNFEGMGLTLVDSLDTLWIMELKDEFKEARDWLEEHFLMGSHPDKQHTSVNLFEVTIRVLGGFLSAYDLSGDDMFLHKAKNVADQFLVAFDSPTGIPFGTVNLASKTASNPGWSGGASSISEVATLQLEWEYLARHVGDPKYSAPVRKVMKKLFDIEPNDSLYPMFIQPNSGRFKGDDITLGARADSLYEYLMKQVLQLQHVKDEETRRHVEMIKGMYFRSVKGVEDHLLARTRKDQLLYIQERYSGQLRDKMDHLVCFVPGMLALGYQQLGAPDKHLTEAREIAKTCHAFYSTMPTGLAPEICKFSGGDHLVADPGAKHSLLRPETVESLFVMYRVTGDQIYRDWGWEMLQAFETHARVHTGGYSSIRDVTQEDVQLTDSMESFFLAETLKYLYLLFSDGETIPLDKYVLTTEAHPLSIFAD